MRERMEKEKTGWKLVTTAKHCDRVNWDPLIEWCHSDAASTVDNDNKQEIKVHSTSLKDGAKVVEYALHDRRYFSDTIENLCPEFKRSSQFGQMKDAQRSYHEKKRRTRAEYLAWKEKRELLGMEIRGALFRKWKSDTTAGEGAGDNAVTLSEDDIDEKVGVLTSEYKLKEARRRATREVLKLNKKRREPTDAEVQHHAQSTPDYPELVVGMKQFRLGFCNCIKHRKSSECDCQLCTYVKSNLVKFHRARVVWRKKKACAEDCPCPAGVLSKGEKALEEAKKDGRVDRISAAEAIVAEEKPKRAAFYAATQSPGQLMTYVLCEPLPDAKVNGPLRQDLSSSMYPGVAAAMKYTPTLTPKKRLEQWQRLYPRWLTCDEAKRPFKVHGHGCLNKQCKPNLFDSTKG